MHCHHDNGAAAPGLAAPERHEVAPEVHTPADGPALLGEDKGQEGQAHCADDGAAAQVALVQRGGQIATGPDLPRRRCKSAARVHIEIEAYIDQDASQHSLMTEKVEVESMQVFHQAWTSRLSGRGSK